MDKTYVINTTPSTDYADKVSALVKDCITTKGSKHAVLLMADADTGLLAIYALNATPILVESLLSLASSIVDTNNDNDGGPRTVQ